MIDASALPERPVLMDAMADGARPRTEMLWLNAAVCNAHGLFGAAALSAPIFITPAGLRKTLWRIWGNKAA